MNRQHCRTVTDSIHNYLRGNNKSLVGTPDKAKKSLPSKRVETELRIMNEKYEVEMENIKLVGNPVKALALVVQHLCQNDPFQTGFE